MFPHLGHQCHRAGRGIGPGDVAADGNHISGETPVQQGREQPSATSHHLEGRGGRRGEERRGEERRGEERRGEERRGEERRGEERRGEERRGEERRGEERRGEERRGEERRGEGGTWPTRIISTSMDVQSNG